MSLLTIIERWFLAESKSSFSTASITAKACVCIPLIAIVVFSKIEPTTIEIINEMISMVKGFVFNKFRGDLDILKPGFRKLKQNTGKPVFGTIPMTKFLLPEEDSITSSSKKLGLNRQNLKKIDSEIEKLSKVVKSSLNIREIEKLL